ncbi:Phosphatidylinositol 4-phosphate 5-kinase type-1 gamma [Dirofilaria immitis]
MGGHRRDQSDSQVPLRQCIEFQQCISSNSQDQIGFHTETSLNIVGPLPNGTINSISSSDLPIYRNDCIIYRQRKLLFYPIVLTIHNATMNDYSKKRTYRG